MMKPQGQLSPEAGGGAVLRGACSIFIVSAAVIALELALMRCLSVASWHHFSYLVISTALLGFGASGTLLSLVGDALKKRFGTWNCGLCLLFAVSGPLCFRAAQALPLEVRYVLFSGSQAAWMLLYHLLLLVPFLVGGTIIGLSLMWFRQRIHLIYGANLAGSGAGGALMVGFMFLLPPGRLLYAVSALAMAAAVLWVSSASAPPDRSRWPRAAAWGVAAVLLLAEGLLWPVHTRVDPYKMLATLQRWEKQSDASELLTSNGPRAQLTVFESPRLHQTLFAGLTATEAPPEQLMVLADGDPAATVFEIDSPADAPILDHTPMSVPYRMLESPRVLLLGEAGGVNVWLALRLGAAHVTVVQSNPQVVELMKGPLARRSGRVFLRPDVTVAEEDPRLFLERKERRYDVIQLVTTEEMTAGTSGLRSLHEDFLLTREGLSLCLEHLSDGGVLSATRGIQTPPRDNIKLFASLVEALESRGVSRPGSHLIQYRNYLAATTLASRRPFDAPARERFRRERRRLSLETTWTPGDAEGQGRTDGERLSLRRAAAEILSPRREQFYREWVYHVRPASDDSPYFHSFFRWDSLWWFVQSFGGHWFQRLELSYVVLVLSLAEVVVVGGVLILLPLLWLRGGAGVRGGRAATAAYFLCLGLAFMMVEMTFIMEFTRFLGDPIYAAAGMLTAFLIFSGLGSATSRAAGWPRRRAIAVAAAVVAGFVLFYLAVARDVLPWFAGWSTPARILVSIVTVAPVAFAMGWMFPSGLGLVHAGAPPLVPWAWGVNGFASVAGSPVAVILAIEWGYSRVLLLAAGLYLAAAAIARALPGERASV